MTIFCFWVQDQIFLQVILIYPHIFISIKLILIITLYLTSVGQDHSNEVLKIVLNSKWGLVTQVC